MSSRPGYGQRRFVMSHVLIEDWLVSGRAIETSLPDDARFVRTYPSESGHGQVFVFESATWDELLEGEHIPQIEVTVEVEQQ